jgi:hypothetical protein
MTLILNSKAIVIFEQAGTFQGPAVPEKYSCRIVLKTSHLWLTVRPGYEPLFSILDGLRPDSERRYWIERREVEGNNCDIKENAGQMSTGVEILLPVSHNTLTSAQEYIQ